MKPLSDDEFTAFVGIDSADRKHESVCRAHTASDASSRASNTRSMRSTNGRSRCDNDSAAPLPSRWS